MSGLEDTDHCLRFYSLMAECESVVHDILATLENQRLGTLETLLKFPHSIDHLAYEVRSPLAQKKLESLEKRLPEVCVVCCGISRLNKPVYNLQIDFDLYLLHLFVTDMVHPSFWQIAEVHPRRRPERSPRRGGRARGGGRGSRSTEDCGGALWGPPVRLSGEWRCVRRH